MYYNKYMKISVHTTRDTVQNLQGGVVKIVKSGSSTSIGRAPRLKSPALQKAARKNQTFSSSSDKWNSLTDSEKETWKSAAANLGISGTALFNQGLSGARSLDQFAFGNNKFGINKFGGAWSSEFTPEQQLAFYKCTCFHFLRASANVKIYQRHFEVYEKIVRGGFRNKTWCAVEITEDPQPPILFAFSYKFLPYNLDDYFDAYIRFYRGDSAPELVFQAGARLYYAPAWKKYETTINESLPDFDFYTIEFEQGGGIADLYLDNLFVKYYNVNFAQDSECNFGAHKFKNGWRTLLPVWESSANYSDFKITTELV